GILQYSSGSGSFHAIILSSSSLIFLSRLFASKGKDFEKLLLIWYVSIVKDGRLCTSTSFYLCIIALPILRSTSLYAPYLRPLHILSFSLVARRRQRPRHHSVGRQSTAAKVTIFQFSTIAATVTVVYPLPGTPATKDRPATMADIGASTATAAVDSSQQQPHETTKQREEATQSNDTLTSIATSNAQTSDHPPPLPPNAPSPADLETDNLSTTSGASAATANSSTKSEERRRRRLSWKREHEKQIKVDGTFPRRNSSRLGGESLNKTAVSAKVVQHLGTKSTANPSTLPPTVSDSVRVRSNLLRTLGIQQERPVPVSVPVPVPVPVQGGAADDDKLPGSPGGLKGHRGRHRRIRSADGKALMANAGGPAGDASMAKVASLAPGPAASGMIPLHPPPNRSLLSVVRLKEELKYDSDEDVEPYPGNTHGFHRFFGSRSSSLDNANGSHHSNSAKIPRRRRLVFASDVEVVPIPMRSEYSNRIKERMYSNRVELSENAQRNVVEFEAEGWDASTVLDDENQFYKCPLTGELIHPVHLAYFSKGAAGGEVKEGER
ncbi:hypothetical protein ACHAXS_009420, partial [Conticribra weissflogii]